MENQPDEAIALDQKATPDYEPRADDKLHGDTPVTASPGETPYTGSHADNYEPDQAPDRNVPKDGPSGERGGGLWTSGGQVTTGTPYHHED